MAGRPLSPGLAQPIARGIACVSATLGSIPRAKARSVNATFKFLSGFPVWACMPNKTGEELAKVVCKNLKAPWLQLGLLFLALSTVFALGAFQNFSAIEVVALQALFGAGPLLLLSRLPLEKGRRRRLAAGRIAMLSSVSLGFVALQIGALVRWQPYFTNFAYARLDAGGGFHQDSAFHVAIIQNILTHGRPSTGQHLTPFLPYHFLSYYFDAAVIRMFGFDPWESYGLLFFAKSTLLLLSVLFFLAWLLRDVPRLPASLAGASLLFAYTSSWHVIGSHTQWIPMTLLLLVAPWLHGVLVSPVVTRWQLAGLTLLVVILTLGKGSLGLAFTAVVALSLLFSRRVTQSVMLAGLFWGAFLLGWGLLSSSGGVDSGLIQWPVEGLPRRLISVHPFVASLVALSGILLVVRKQQVAKSPAWSPFALPVAATVVLLVAAFAGISRSRSDAFYFMSGLFAVAIVLYAPLLLRVALDASARRKAVVVALAIALAFSPVISRLSGPISPYGDIFAIADVVRAGSTVTYTWSNELVSNGDRMSVLRAFGLDKRSGRPASAAQSPFRRLADSTSSLLESHALARRDVLLYVPFEHGAVIESAASGPAWATGLLLTAITGLPQVYGVPEGGRQSYGFSTYGQFGSTALRRSSAEVSSDELCGFGKAVVVVEDFASAQVRLACFGPHRASDVR